MKKLLSISVLLFALQFGTQAQAAGQRPVDMTASGAIVGTQVLWCQTPGTVVDRACTFTQVAAYINSLVSGDCTATGTGAFTCTKTNGTAFGALATVTPGTGVATLLAGASSGTGGPAGTTSPTFTTPALGTPSALVGTNITGTGAGFTAGNVTTNANLTGDVTSVGNATTLTNAPVIAKVLTGFTSGAGTVSAADSILSALQKINGNDALKAPLASPTFTGVPAAPTATVGTNTTQLATTAFVIANAGSGTGANPTATASDTAVNGVATTFMRSDAAPAVQKTSASVFGLAKVDGTTITATGGVISAVSGSGTVTSVSAGCGTSTGGSPITTTGTVSGAVTSRSVTGATDAVIAGDCGNRIVYNSASSIAVTMSNTTGSFAAGYYVPSVCNINAGVVTFTPTTATVGGQSTYALPAGTATNPTCISFIAVSGDYQIHADYTVNASLLSGGTVAAARGGAGTITGALKGNGAGVVSQAACADLSNGATGCSTATGTSGATLPLLNGTNTFSGTQTFGSVFGSVSTQAGTTYTLASTDCGTEIAFTNAAAVTVTIPAALTTGCNIVILQTTSAGQVTVTGTAVSAATLHSAHSYTKTFGQWAAIGINIYTTGVAILTGDGA